MTSLRRKWLPAWLGAGAATLFVIVTVQLVLHFLDRLHPDWAGLARVAPLLAYVGCLLVVYGANSTYIRVSETEIDWYQNPIPWPRGGRVPNARVEQILFWETRVSRFSHYSLALQTRNQRHEVFHYYRSRDEVMAVVKKIADELGRQGLATVKVAETRAVVSPIGTNPIPLIGVALLGVLLVALARA
jgi:hypothetical protein